MADKTGIKFISPASISFFSFGIENLSFALDHPSNEVIVNVNENSNETEIALFTCEKYDKSGIKTELKKVSDRFLHRNNCVNGVSFEIYNKIPVDLSLGNLESGIAACVSGINELCNLHFDKNKIFNQICDIANEMNINVNIASIATSLFGGIISYNSNTLKRIEKIYCPKGIFVSIFKSNTFIDAGEEIPVLFTKEISADIVSIINSLQVSDMDILSQSLKNNNFQKSLNRKIPYFDEVVERSMLSGAIGAGFTKAGGALIIFYPNTLFKNDNNKIIENLLNEHKIKFQKFDARINLNGLYKA